MPAQVASSTKCVGATSCPSLIANSWRSSLCRTARKSDKGNFRAIGHYMTAYRDRFDVACVTAPGFHRGNTSSFTRQRESARTSRSRSATSGSTNTACALRRSSSACDSIEQIRRMTKPSEVFGNNWVLFEEETRSRIAAAADINRRGRHRSRYRRSAR